MKVTVIGAGSWGTAVALHVAKSHPEHTDIQLCPRTEKHAIELQIQQENKRYLPEVSFPKNLQITSDWSKVFHQPNESDHLLIIATPFSGLTEVVSALIDFGRFPLHWIWLCKGIDPISGNLPHEVIADIFSRKPISHQINYGVLSGPSFAIEVAKGLPCALTVASQSMDLCQFTQKVLHHGNMRIYATDDVVGVELGGAIKNILAIATGIVDGLHLGLNARAALITRGMAEMSRLGLAMGADQETFMGLTGLGDLILTATGDLSRNRRVGLELAQGKSLTSILENLGHVAEGVRCAQAVKALAQSHHVNMPIVETVCAVLFDHLSPQEAVKQIMSRDPRHE
jgi:glycerol-3-phosphate dehydrogenase (NAD(P)+)